MDHDSGDCVAVFSLTNDLFFQCSLQCRKFGDASAAGVLMFTQLCHDNFFLSPVVDHGFVDFKFSCCCSVSICMSDNFELLLKTLMSVFNTGHFDSKLFVATLIVNDCSVYFSFSQLPFYNVLNHIKTSSIAFVNKLSFSVKLVSFHTYCF